MNYWVYEDMITHTATVHRGDCHHCNHGAGRGRGRDEQKNWWHPHPYESVDDARSAPLTASAIIRPCGASPCRDDAALTALG
jgi:hypothetical protein